MLSVGGACYWHGKLKGQQAGEPRWAGQNLCVWGDYHEKVAGSGVGGLATRALVWARWLG